MGKLLMGGTGPGMPTGSKAQRGFVDNLLQGQGGMGGEAFSQMVQPYDSGNFQDLFQQTFVDPAMMNYERNVLPSIQQRYGDADAGSSSALNQALSQSAADVSTMIGSQAGGFYNQQQDRALQAMGMGSQTAGLQQQEPSYQGGVLGELIRAVAMIAGGA